MIFRRKNGVDREVVLRYNELGVSYGASINITILEFRKVKDSFESPLFLREG